MSALNPCRKPYYKICMCLLSVFSAEVDKALAVASLSAIIKYLEVQNLLGFDTIHIT